MGHECPPVLSNMRDHQPERHWGRQLGKEGEAHRSSACTSEQAVSQLHRQWVLLRLSLTWEGFVIPYVMLLHPHCWGGSMWGLMHRKCKVKYWDSRDCAAYLPPQNVLEKSGKSLHISSTASTEFQSLWRSLRTWAPQHSTVTLLKSSQVISISLTTGVQVSTLNLLLKHFEINIPTFHVLKEVHSLCQK